ncbi:MAG: adenosylcobinamide-GDP ribazoletransferase [Litoreibacter sp.]|nr:adenosylcobinamide-GDP ribazoletransferase [Litoreibacter sp.]
MPHDVLVALSLLTRLPTPDPDWTVSRPAACAAWAYPLAGMLVAGIAGLIGAMALALGAIPGLSAAVSLTALILMTGAMHEDGLADTADGFWGGWDKARRLEIMKDSRIGTYGVIALVLTLLMRWLALTAIFAAGSTMLSLIAAAVLSRAAMVGVMTVLPNARDDGLSRSTGRPPRETAFSAGAIALVLVLAGFGVSGIALVLAACLGACVVGGLASAKIGGQTGDVLGATQQISEILVLAALTLVLSA